MAGGGTKAFRRGTTDVETWMVRGRHLTRNGGVSVTDVRSSRQRALWLKLDVLCARSKAEWRLCCEWGKSQVWVRIRFHPKYKEAEDVKLRETLLTEQEAVDRGLDPQDRCQWPVRGHKRGEGEQQVGRGCILESCVWVWSEERRLVDLGEDWGAKGLEDKSESEKLTAASWPREGGDPARFWDKNTSEWSRLGNYIADMRLRLKACTGWDHPGGVRTRRGGLGTQSWEPWNDDRFWTKEEPVTELRKKCPVMYEN